jgi:hypothetical protein
MRYYYSRRWRQKTIPSYFSDGLEVHAVLSGELDIDDVPVHNAKTAQRLMDTENGLGFTIIHREVEQEFDIVPDLSIIRRIDAIGFNSTGEPVIIDYKTSSKKWSFVGGEAPKASSWQTCIYLIPPPKELYDAINWTAPWPKQMGYLVASPVSVQYIPISMTKKWMADFYKMLGHLRYTHDNNAFYMNKGWHCEWCPFKDRCYGTPNYAEKYERRLAR